MGGISDATQYRVVTVTDYSVTEDDPDPNTVGCVWEAAKEASVVNKTTVEEEFEWLLKNNKEALGENPNLVHSGEKLKVRFLPDKDNGSVDENGVEAVGVKKDGDAVILQKKDGKFSGKGNENIDSYRHLIAGGKGSYVQIPVKKGQGGDDTIVVNDEGIDYTLRPGESRTTTGKTTVRNLPGDKYAVTSKDGKTVLINPKGDKSENMESKSEVGKAAARSKQKYPKESKNIDDLVIEMAAKKVDEPTQEKIIGSYGKLIESKANDDVKGKVKYLLVSKDFYEAFYKLNDDVQNKAFGLFLKYAMEGDGSKFDSVRKIVMNNDYQSMEKDKQIQFLTEYQKNEKYTDPENPYKYEIEPFANSVDRALNSEDKSLDGPIRTLDVIMYLYDPHSAPSD